MNSLNIFSYLKILIGILILLFSTKVYNSYALFQEMLLTEIDWKIEFSKLSLIINSVILFLLLWAGKYVFLRKNKNKA